MCQKKMDIKHFVWSAQNGEIWEVARKLQENAIQVDVYLQTTGDGHCSVKESCNSCGTLSDILSTEDKEHSSNTIAFPAHKLMLAAASPFLSKVLSEHYHEHHDPCVNITVPCVSPDALRYILNFIYFGNVSIPAATRTKVLEAAELLQIMSLIHYFQADSVVSKGINEYDHRNCREIACDSPQKRVRKRKSGKMEAVDIGHFSELSTQVKKETTVVQKTEKCTDSQLGRRRRVIRSRYNSEVYEINLPKLRKFKSERSSDAALKEEKLEMRCQVSVESARESENHHTYAMPTSPSCNRTSEDVVGNELKCDKGEIENINVVKPTVTGNTRFNLEPEKASGLETQLLTLSSSSPSSSIIIPQLFTSDAACLQDSSRSHSLTELPCASFIEQQVPIAGIPSESFESPSFAMVPSTSSSLLSQIKDLPLMSSPASLQHLPLKQESIVIHPQETDEDLEKNEEEEQDDGLFKFQVLLKECGDFSEAANASCVPVADGVVDASNKYQEGGGDVDINQWITSEEIHSYIIPKTADGTETKKQPESENNVSEFISLEVASGEDNKATACSQEPVKAGYECEICRKTYADVRSCQSHVRRVHHTARQMCRYCGKMFKRRCDLYQHERRHKKASLPCEVCGKIFKLHKDLAAHRTTHTGGKQFDCSQCNKRLTSLRNLKNHIANIHQKQRTFACQMCGKAYSKSSSLQVHVRSIHTGERPYVCGVCKKSFCDSSLLRLHRVTHTGEKKYSCKVCKQRFSQYSNMISHQQVHTTDRPFTCVICKENFKTKEGLLKHKWVHTGLKPLRCHHCSKEFRVKESYEKHMVKCHDEIICLPEIYFEIPEEMVSEEPNKSSSTIRVVRTIGASDVQTQSPFHVNSSRSDVIPEKNPVRTNLTESLSPAVHCATFHLTTTESGQVQLSYPLLSSNASVEEPEDMTLGGVANEITSCSNVAQSIDVESFLQDEVISDSAIMLPKDSATDVMTSSIHETVISECNEVVILNKSSKGNDDESSNDIDPSPAINIWMSTERSVVDDPHNDDGANILIVSEQALTEAAKTLPMLSSGMVSPVVESMLNTPPPSDVPQ